MTAAIGYPTLRLICCRIGDWTLDGLAPGCSGGPSISLRHLAAPPCPGAIDPLRDLELPPDDCPDGNLWADIPASLPAERFDCLLQFETCRLAAYRFHRPRHPAGRAGTIKTKANGWCCCKARPACGLPTMIASELNSGDDLWIAAHRRHQWNGPVSDHRRSGWPFILARSPMVRDSSDFSSFL